MAENKTLIIHGWSDCSGSFKHMKQRFAEAGIGDVETILYADYESREDNLTFNDVIDGLNRQMVKRGLIDEKGESESDINVVVHSTGGLVVRHWIWRYYHDNIDRCPVKRILMLAPANFGSPLAHRGKSFLGRMVKGRWKVGDLLEVGRNLLDGLELASPYQWDLAHKDLFITGDSYYNRDQIQLTVLTGIEDYGGIRGWVNKPGTDGTIVIAGSSLDSIKLTLDFSDANIPHKWSEVKTASDFCFGVLQKLDHGSIVGEFENKESAITKLVIQALKIDGPVEFKTYKDQLRALTNQTYQVLKGRKGNKYSKFQQFVIHAVDDHGTNVDDFTIEFYVYKAEKSDAGIVEGKKYFNQKERELSDEVQKLMLGNIHTHSIDSSYRRLLVNLNDMAEFMVKAKERIGEFVISMRIYVPEIDKGIYYDTKSLQNVVIYRSDKSDSSQPSLFFGNTTTLIELKVDRITNYVTISENPKK